MKLEDIKIGKKFIHNNTEYLRIDFDLSTMYANGSAYDGIICALNLSTYKVVCFFKSTEILRGN